MAKKKKKIKLKAYGDFVTQMASESSMSDFKAKIGTGGLGLAGEAGEIADLTKKILYHGMEWNDEVREKMVKEMGDLLWYAAFVARNVLDVSIKDILEANVKKLNDRYKSGKFTTKEFMAKEDCKKE